MHSPVHSNIGIYGYGSLLSKPGKKIEPHIIDRISLPSPWPIEYARRSKGWGLGPTVVIHRAGGTVQGQILVLDVKLNLLSEVREWLRKREGKPPPDSIKEMRLGGLDHVLYCDLESNIPDAEINPESLAKFAIESVRINPEKSGIRYLRQNIDRGLITPLTYAYRDAILKRTRAQDLVQAEEIVLEGSGVGS